MTHRDGIKSHKSSKFRLQQIALHQLSADRIGPVQHHEGLALLRSRLHRQGHGVDVGVEARPDILNVIHQHIDVFEHFRGRLVGLAVEAEDRNILQGIDFRVDLAAGFLLAADAVLRPEQGGDGHPGHRHEHIGDVPALGVVGGVVGDDPHPLAGKQLGELIHPVQSGAHYLRRWGLAAGQHGDEAQRE